MKFFNTILFLAALFVANAVVGQYGASPSYIIYKTHPPFVNGWVMGTLGFGAQLDAVFTKQITMEAIIVGPYVDGEMPVDFRLSTGTGELNERLRVLYGGNVGINDSAPVAQLSVKLNAMENSGGSIFSAYSTDQLSGPGFFVDRISAANGRILTGIRQGDLVVDQGKIEVENVEPGAQLLRVSGEEATFSVEHFASNLLMASLDGHLTLNRGNLTVDNGKVGINTSYIPNDYQMAVNGLVLSTGFDVKSFPGWPDYVFDANYYLLPLEEIEDFIATHGHLPGMPDAVDVATNGFSLNLMIAKNLEKIEELTLHLIAQKKERDKAIAEKDDEIIELRSALETQQRQIDSILKRLEK